VQAKQEPKVSPITLTQDKCFAITSAAKLTQITTFTSFFVPETYSAFRRQMVSENFEKSSFMILHQL